MIEDKILDVNIPCDFRRNTYKRLRESCNLEVLALEGLHWFAYSLRRRLATAHTRSRIHCTPPRSSSRMFIMELSIEHQILATTLVNASRSPVPPTLNMPRQLYTFSPPTLLSAAILSNDWYLRSCIQEVHLSQQYSPQRSLCFDYLSILRHIKVETYSLGLVSNWSNSARSQPEPAAASYFCVSLHRVHRITPLHDKTSQSCTLY